MIALNDMLLVLVPLVYLAALFAYWLDAGETRRPPRWAPRLLAVAALVSHGMLVWARFEILGHAPWTTYHDALLALGFLTTLTYVLVEAITGVSSTGLDLLVAPFIAVVWASAFGPRVPKELQEVSPFFLLHTVPALGGFAAIVVSGMYGLLYLRLARAIRKKRFGPLFRRLPDLEILARMNFWAATVGFLLVTAAIGWGASWYGDLFEQVDVTEPAIFLTLLIWTVLLVPLFGRPFRRWPDRATAVVSVITMGLAVLSIAVMLLPFISFHGSR